MLERILRKLRRRQLASEALDRMLHTKEYKLDDNIPCIVLEGWDYEN